MGLYPMLPDETCRFLALDLDKADWRADAVALLETCGRLKVPAALERSRSGNGAHLWIFFTEPVSAVLARKLGAVLLTGTMERRPELGFDSYDRMFPNQDTLPSGGFGNLIALPLQFEARKSSNKLFLKENVDPWSDPWAFLASLQRMTRAEVARVVEDAQERDLVLGVRAVPEEEGLDKPWRLKPSRLPSALLEEAVPERVVLTLSDQIYIEKSDVTPSLRNRLLRLAAFQNPEFYKAQAMRLPTYTLPQIIACAEEYPDHVALPRGCLEDVKTLLKHYGIRRKTVDKRFKGVAIHVEFQGELRDDQQKAMNHLLKHDTGVLAATTAFGKTVLAAAVIAERGVNTLILVHRKQLMEQWVERLSTFLSMSEKEFGCLGGGKRSLKGKVDVALLPSLVRKGQVDDRIAEYGQVIVDECHHVSARNFELGLRRAKARYVLGLSATVTRKDGHHPIIFMQCGPVRHRVEARDHAGTQSFSKQVIVRPTGFKPLVEDSENIRQDFGRWLNEISLDESRNRMIVEDVLSALEANEHPLVLTERVEHLSVLAEAFLKRGVLVVQLRGGLSSRELDTALKSRDVEKRVVIATGKFVGEGFDDPKLDALFLTMPVSWKGVLTQYVGRLHRQVNGKTRVRVYDYADVNHPVFSRMFDRRCKVYEALGYTVLIPASAIPGWPTDVPLPVNPEWKRDHGNSVRRLVRDGVDIPLAQLFVDASYEAVSGELAGEDRARSASELFLWRRLESLGATAGRFKMNETLAIPFRGQGFMEVDFLDREAKLVIELDGAAHFASLEAYRRDREKDMLLQENGFWVLRFLAGDLTTHLDAVLDLILRAVGRRETTDAVRQ
ncbi:MAG: DEAD/DEAH box helicase family protein [Kiritimatiellae bacterium]|nr:DEAD/DEAH box helicase family protein [Kiritimatiellia bacterium]